MKATTRHAKEQYQKHLDAMRRWRLANPGYMKDYYDTHPKQLRRHKQLVNIRNKEIRNDPVLWAQYLKATHKRITTNAP